MLNIIKIEVSELRIPFNVTFSHASASRKETQSVWVKVITTSGLVGYGEGCPREYVTGESIKSANTFIADHKRLVTDSVHDLQSLTSWVKQHKTVIDTNPAAWCAIELALLDVIAQDSNCSVEELLGIPIHRETFTYTAVLGNSKLSNLHKQVIQYQKLGLEDFKVKLSGNLVDDKAKLDLLVGNTGNPRIRVDANNLWQNKDDVIEYIRSLDVPIFAIEEPIMSGQYKDLADMSYALGMRIILDESFKQCAQLSYLKEEPDCWILNVRVSKMGGLLRSLNIIHEAKRLGIPIIIGAHVGETSLLTRAGFVVAQAAKNSLLAQEGGFSTYLLKYDICDKPLQFLNSGRINYPYQTIAKPGFGLAIQSPS